MKELPEQIKDWPWPPFEILDLRLIKQWRYGNDHERSQYRLLRSLYGENLGLATLETVLVF